MRLAFDVTPMAAWLSRIAMHPRNCPRRCAQHENLTNVRGRACPILHMLRNILPPSMFQFTVPGFKQAGDLLNLLGLLHRVRTDLSGELAVDAGRWYLPDGSGGVFINAFTELLEHFHGCVYLGGSGCLHGGY